MLKISKKAQKLTSSPLYVFFRKVKERESAGEKIISLGVGEPYNDTPNEIKKAGIDAINNNKTRYNPAAGSIDLRKKLAVKYGVGIENVSVSSGAKPFLAFVFMSLLDDGDVVLMAAPFYPPFVQIVESCGGNVELIETRKNNFQLTLETVRDSATKHLHGDKKIHLLLNSPNNPTGATYNEIELRKIVEWCQENDVVVISDECYSNFSSNKDFTVRNFSNEVIVINSFSKTYAMTGWRVGYVICPQELNVVIGRYLDSYLGCASSIADAAAVTAMDQPPLDDFISQRQLVHDWLKLNDIDYVESTGGIFIFPDFSKFMKSKNIKNSTDLATYFLEKAGVATTPGISFGNEYDTHLRLSYCVKMDELELALEKMKSVL